jgi:4-hydroxy-tetrahydrodipicolinate reductase
MDNIKVAVLGSSGKMGQSVVSAVNSADGMVVVKQIDTDNIADLSSLKNVDVLVDFTVFDASKKNIPIVVKQGINVIIGTSGWSNHKNELSILSDLSKEYKSNILIAPNFAIGAILEKKFACIAAKYFNSAEIVEMHHNNKIDAPSGTAIDTAMAVGDIIKDKEKDATIKQLDGARGCVINGIHIHSIRQIGLLAHQEITFGALGERLTIRHDSFTRESFMGGVLFAIKNIKKHKGLKVGLENYL